LSKNKYTWGSKIFLLHIVYLNHSNSYSNVHLTLFCYVLTINDLFYPADEKEIGEVKDKDDSYALLEEIEMPENCQMDGIEYLGPPIDDTMF